MYENLISLLNEYKGTVEPRIGSHRSLHLALWSMIGLNNHDLLCHAAYCQSKTHEKNTSNDNDVTLIINKLMEYLKLDETEKQKATPMLLSLITIDANLAKLEQLEHTLDLINKNHSDDPIACDILHNYIYKRYIDLKDDINKDVNELKKLITKPHNQDNNLEKSFNQQIDRINEVLNTSLDAEAKKKEIQARFASDINHYSTKADKKSTSSPSHTREMWNQLGVMTIMPTTLVALACSGSDKDTPVAFCLTWLLASPLIIPTGAVTATGMLIATPGTLIADLLNNNDSDNSLSKEEITEAVTLAQTEIQALYQQQRDEDDKHQKARLAEIDKKLDLEEQEQRSNAQQILKTLSEALERGLPQISELNELNQKLYFIKNFLANTEYQFNTTSKNLKILEEFDKEGFNEIQADIQAIKSLFANYHNDRMKEKIDNLRQKLSQLKPEIEHYQTKDPNNAPYRVKELSEKADQLLNGFSPNEYNKFKKDIDCLHPAVTKVNEKIDKHAKSITDSQTKANEERVRILASTPSQPFSTQQLQEIGRGSSFEN